MFSTGPQYNKLKTNLRLAMARLKLLGKKKTEMAQRARKEIADYISDRKEDRARIKVEHIIREDYMVEAYELVEMYCDMLLARFGMIEQMKDLDDGIYEAVVTVLWAAPRLQGDVQELKIISDQLTAKYGKQLNESALQDEMGKVHPKLKAKMDLHAPPKILVERYMIEIAKSHGVPFTPDQDVMKNDEIAAAEAMLTDYGNQGGGGAWMFPQPPGQAPGGPPAGPQIGFEGVHPSVGGGQTFDGTQQQPFSYPTLPNQVPYPSQSGAEPSFPDAPGDFPNPPQDGAPADGRGGSNDDMDFDDLHRRFEELKKRR